MHQYLHVLSIASAHAHPWLPSGLHAIHGLANANELITYNVHLRLAETGGACTGVLLTGDPIGHGGSNPYAVVPTCFLQSGQHLFHDEVNPSQNKKFGSSHRRAFTSYLDPQPHAQVDNILLCLH